MSVTITCDYYDLETYQMLFEALTEEDEEYTNNAEENINQLLFKRWQTIINSLPPNYYQHYGSQLTSKARNAWFKKYLVYPTKDLSQMPELL
jgi:hypothetical protein